MDKHELSSFMKREFPQVADYYVIEKVAFRELHMRLVVDERHLRPGGTVSGPSMFSLADVSVYLAILAEIGPKALCVTTNCSLDFMRRPDPADMISEARILKLGKSLAVGDVLLYTVGHVEPVARVSMTYSIPPPSAR